MSTTQDSEAFLWTDSVKYIAQAPQTLEVDQKAQDYDFAATPGRSALQGSHFVGLYNEYAGWHLKENEKTKQVMVQAAYDFLAKYIPPNAQTAMKLQPTFDSVQQGCVQLYTSNWTYGSGKTGAKKIYSFINHAIFHDNYEQLKRFMPIIRMLNSYLRVDGDSQHAATSIVYRGIKLRDSVIAKFVANEECRFATYFSTSHVQSVAAHFANISPTPGAIPNAFLSTTTAPEPWSKVIFKIELPPHKQAPHFRSIQKHSVYAHEDEVLFVPYSKFRILKPAVQLVTNTGTYQLIELRAIDNVNENNPVPSGPTKYVPTPPASPVVSTPSSPVVTPTSTTTTTTPTTPIKKKPPPTHNYF